MTKKIYKYEAPILDKFRLYLPVDSEILCVQIDEKTGFPCIWILVDPEKEDEERYFELFGTGHEIPCDMGINRKYIGTYQTKYGQSIFHLFERIN